MKIKKLVTSSIAAALIMTSINPGSVFASATYKLNNSVDVYLNASDASNNKNSVRKYSAGNYYIYKTFNGMYNISKTNGKPGAWMNPSSNKAVETSEPKETQPKETQPKETKPKEIKVGDKITIDKNLKAYQTAADALLQKSTNITYRSGSYYVYRIHSGATNISRTKGKPGAWVLLTGQSQKVEETKETKETTKPKSYPKSASVTVPSYTQINSWYCGPATMQSLLKYINGSKRTQQSIAKSMGTWYPYGNDMKELITFINSNQKSYKYRTKNLPSLDQFKNDIKSNIVDKKMPIILRIKIVNMKGVPYNASGGHFMLAIGYDSNGDRIKVMDPFAPRAGKKYSNVYYLNTSDVYNATKIHPWHHYAY